MENLPVCIVMSDEEALVCAHMLTMCEDMFHTFGPTVGLPPNSVDVLKMIRLKIEKARLSQVTKY